MTEKISINPSKLYGSSKVDSEMLANEMTECGPALLNSVILI